MKWGIIPNLSLSEFLWHFDLVAALNRLSHRQKGLYLGVRLGGSALKILESVDAFGDGRYQQLVRALEQRYQLADKSPCTGV